MKVYEVTTSGAPGARLVYAKKGPAMENFNRRCEKVQHRAHTVVLHRIKPLNKETIVALVRGHSWAERSEVIAYCPAQRDQVAA